MVRLYIVRHGDPDYDTDRRNGGSLTDHGKKEAEALSTFFRDKNESTHAYSSPMGRARLTAKLALSKIPKFSGENFETNCGIEEWSKELSNWRLGRPVKDDGKGAGSGSKTPAIWDLPASITRSRLGGAVTGTDETVPGWAHTCGEHAVYLEEYADLCEQSDAFLARHGIIRDGHIYKMRSSDASDPKKRHAQIVVFCHGGLGLTWLAHLLHLPLPLVHSSFWLAPSSVTTILFDEWQGKDKNVDDNGSDILMTPRALCVSGTSHLAAAGLETVHSKYEDYERPSGLKKNYY